MKIRFSKGWAECEIEPQDIELERACPVCRLGKTAQGVCSECKGEGIIITLLGVEILDFVRRRLGTDFMRGSANLHTVNSISEARNGNILNTIKSNGKSIVVTTSKLPEHPKDREGVKAQHLPHAQAVVPARASAVQRVQKTAVIGHPPQKRSW